MAPAAPEVVPVCTNDSDRERIRRGCLVDDRTGAVQARTHPSRPHALRGVPARGVFRPAPGHRLRAAVRQGPAPQGSVRLGYGTFSPVGPERLQTLDVRVAEATAAGMDVARVMVDWVEIETEAGAYDPTLLDDQLERVPDGTRLFLALGVTDVDRYALPADLLASLESAD